MIFWVEYIRLKLRHIQQIHQLWHRLKRVQVIYWIQWWNCISVNEKRLDRALSGIWCFGFCWNLFTSLRCLDRKVYKAKLLTTQEVIAIKEVELEENFKSRELELLRSMIHPNIVRLKYFFHTTTSSSSKQILCLIMEYMPMSAHHLISEYRRNHKIMPLFYIKLFVYQMLRGLGYLHIHGVVSRYWYREICELNANDVHRHIVIWNRQIWLLIMKQEYWKYVTLVVRRS